MVRRAASKTLAQRSLKYDAGTLRTIDGVVSCRPGDCPGRAYGFLERVSDGDPRRELESLLAAHEQGAYTEKRPEDIAAGLFLAEQDGATGGTVRKTLAPHTRIDRYAIASTNLHTGKRSPVGEQSAPHASQKSCGQSTWQTICMSLLPLSPPPGWPVATKFLF